MYIVGYRNNRQLFIPHYYYIDACIIVKMYIMSMVISCMCISRNNDHSVCRLWQQVTITHAENIVSQFQVMESINKHIPPIVENSVINNCI